MSEDLKYSEEELGRLGQEFMDKFRDKMKKISEEVLGEIYSELMPHIQGESWTNYRNYLNEGFSRGYVKDDFRASYHKELRKTIFLENKDEMIDLLNKDLVERVKQLEDIFNKPNYDRYF